MTVTPRGRGKMSEFEGNIKDIGDEIYGGRKDIFEDIIGNVIEIRSSGSFRALSWIRTLSWYIKISFVSGIKGEAMSEGGKCRENCMLACNSNESSVKK